MYVTNKTETQQDAEKASGTGGMDTGRVVIRVVIWGQSGKGAEKRTGRGRGKWIVAV